MPKKTTDKHKAAYIPFRCSPSTYETISEIAKAGKTTTVQVVRDLVEQGLVAAGYKQDEEHLEKLIQAAVKTAMKPQVERLAAISAKATQIAGAAFFMAVYMAKLILPPVEQQLVDEAAAQARKLGIEYLKLKDRDVDAFLQGGVEKMSDNQEED